MTKGLIWQGAMALIGLLVLVGLGTWQLERKAWKEGLIASIAARSKADPISVGEAAGHVRAGNDAEYTRVSARGTSDFFPTADREDRQH